MKTGMTIVKPNYEFIYHEGSCYKRTKYGEWLLLRPEHCDLVEHWPILPKPQKEFLEDIYQKTIK